MGADLATVAATATATKGGNGSGDGQAQAERAEAGVFSAEDLKEWATWPPERSPEFRALKKAQKTARFKFLKLMKARVQLQNEKGWVGVVAGMLDAAS